MMQKAVILFSIIAKNFPISTREGGREAHQEFIGFSISPRIVSFLFFLSSSLSRVSFARWKFVKSSEREISCHYYLSLFSSFSPTNIASSAIVGVIFSIKFIHLLIIAVNHSSCNEFYEFLLMHAGSFFAHFFVALGHIPVCWASSLVRPSFLLLFFMLKR